MGNMRPVFTKRNKTSARSSSSLLLQGFCFLLWFWFCLFAGWLLPRQWELFWGVGHSQVVGFPVSWEGEVWSCYSRGTAGVGNALSCEGGTLLACDPTSVSNMGEKAHVLSEGGQPQLGSKLFIQTLSRKKASAQKPTTPAAAHKSQSNEVKMNIACLLSAPRSLEV